VASSKNRQRALARAKVERQIARRAAAARRRRQIQGGVGAGLIVVLVAVGLVWINGGFSRHKKTTTPVAAQCAWTPQDPSTNTNLKDVGTPPTTNIPNRGTRTMTITTNQGVISAQLNLQNAPCTAASFAYLAGKSFFNNTKCHRLTTSGIFVLQCGDPSGTGQGGPTYKFPDKYKPPADQPAPDASGGATPQPSPSASTAHYPRGSLAMANSGPDTNGSQFFIVYKDSPLPADYTLFGAVTSGLDVVDKVAAGGTDGKFDPSPGGGHPKTEVTIQSLVVGDVVNGSAASNGSSSPSASASTP
jgi:peptidyl-prolyl cis-trans isomerase B (cyclophilin B)